jgi:hypothetical protein
VSDLWQRQRGKHHLTGDQTMSILSHQTTHGEMDIQAWANAQWAAEDAAAQQAVASAAARIRQRARFFGMTLAGMDRLHSNRRTVESIRWSFRLALGSLASFDRDAAAALKREVSDLMDERERHPLPTRDEPDTDSDPDAAFDCGYECASLGWPDTPPSIGYDDHERRAFLLGQRTAAFDLEMERSAV